MSYLLDTNVISELRKGSRCDSSVAQWFETVPREDIFLSALTLGEIRKGIENVRRRDAHSARALEAWLRELLETHKERILPVDLSIAEEWGRLNVPDPLPVIDGLLAATAKIYRLTLATRNLKDVERSGVACMNPFLAT